MLYIKVFVTVVVIVTLISFLKDFELFKNRELDNLIASFAVSVIIASITTSLTFLWSL